MIDTTNPTNKAPKVLSNSPKLRVVGERALMIDGQDPCTVRDSGIQESAGQISGDHERPNRTLYEESPR